MDPDDPNPLRLLWPSLANIWKRDRDPFLNQLRWRLHLRLLLISAALSAGFFVRGLLLQGSLDLGLGLGATLLAWLFLRRFPAYNRWVVRLNLTLFVSLGIHGLWQRPGPAYPIELLALMIMPVFGTLLDGVSTGAVVLAAGLASTGLWLERSGLRASGDSLAVLFSLLGSSSLYFCCVAHTWIFTSLVEEQRSSKEAVQATQQEVERLAATLSDQVFTQTQRLRTDLTAQGLSGLAAAQDLQATLAQARSKRPLEIPRNPVIAAKLLQDLRRWALSVFLRIALLLCGLSLAVMLAIHPPEWQLAAGMTAFCALLYLGSRRSLFWRGRLRLFVAVALLTCAADVLLSFNTPPAASLVFTPVIIFFAAMLDDLGPASAAGAAALAVVALGWAHSQPGSPYRSMLSTIGLILPALIAISACTLPIYRALLEQLSVEEAQLTVGLNAYRRLMSTFFHDLANPLAVLQTLAALPEALQVPDDALRAQRMALRMELVAQAARQALLGAAPTRSQTTLAQLGDELYDLFKERLREKQLQWVLGEGAELSLAQSGPLLRDSVLGNLLSNAVKFSPPGGSLELRARKDGAFMRIQLSDTGRGIPAQVLEDLDQGRSPQSQPGTQGETGSGFGLLLAKTYMAELGGSLQLRSRPSGGTEAELILPLA